MSDAAIHVDATHSALQFVLSGCTPVASIDGGQPFAIRWNQPTPVGVAAGAHRVTVWCPYAGSPQMGLASVDVQLAPGQGVLATWAAPGTALGQGTFSLAGAAAPPAAPQQYGQQQYGQQQYGSQQYGQPAGSPPDSYLVWAILSTLFCCLPLGIASIIFASQVSSKYAAGDIAGAQESARKAKNFAVWSAVATLAAVGLGILLFVVLAVGGARSSYGG